MPFPVIYSVAHSPSLITEVAKAYAIGEVVDLQFLGRGMNDTYLLRTKDCTFVLRLYSSGARTESDVLYELDYLRHLSSHGMRVSGPVYRRDGRPIHVISAPEGIRMMVLFNFLPGQPVRFDKPGLSRAYCFGTMLGELHKVADMYRCPYVRFSMDMDYLLIQPMQTLYPLLRRYQKEWSYLSDYVGALYNAAPKVLTGALNQGYCHGDPNEFNTCVDASDNIGLFDFDCCGYSWRAYDLASFRWALRLRGASRTAWQEFLDGYQSCRNLSNEDVLAVNYFVPVRHIWAMGVRASKSLVTGHQTLVDFFFSDGLTFLRDWQSKNTYMSGLLDLQRPT